jgi:Rps23 Pro-64 3,4-dihydroxylase Tpa1-like proline 4-hydroxylase
MVMTLPSFLGTTHIKLILFPTSQILKRTASRMNTQIHIHYLPKTKNEIHLYLTVKKHQWQSQILVSQKSLSCYKQIKAVNIFRMTTGYEDSVSQ